MKGDQHSTSALMVQSLTNSKLRRLIMVIFLLFVCFFNLSISYPHWWNITLFSNVVLNKGSLNFCSWYVSSRVPRKCNSFTPFPCLGRSWKGRLCRYFFWEDTKMVHLQRCRKKRCPAKSLIEYFNWIYAYLMLWFFFFFLSFFFFLNR